MTIKSLLNSNKEILDKTHTVNGWVQTVRSSDSTFGFCLLYDGSSISGLQIIISKEFLDQEKYFIINFTKNFLFIFNKLFEY